MNQNIWDNKELIRVLQEGGVAVMPTDTIYGMVGQAKNESTVERIYKIRNRDLQKPCIILISGMDELEKFSINVTPEQKEQLGEFWSFDYSQDLPPRGVSVVLDCPNEALAYLHRGTSTLAFRVPHVEPLRALLRETGPLIAPSANTEKFPQSENIEDAKKYFGDNVDLYVDGGPIIAKASKVIRLEKEGSVQVLRA